MADYFVKNGGNNVLDGLSDGNAWETISKVNGVSFSAGDTVSFNKGDEWREQLSIPTAGSAGSLITFGAYGTGANPIINGSDLYDGVWSDEGGNVWSIACTTEPNVVWFDDTLGTEDGTPDAEFDWYWNANELFVWSDNVGGPTAEYTTPGVEAGARTYGILFPFQNRDYIKLEYLTIRHSNHTGVWVGNAANNCEFDNLLVEYNQWRDGFVLTGVGTDNNTVTNSVFRYNGSPSAEAGGGCIIFDRAADNTIEDCESHNNSEDGFGVAGNEAGGENNVGGINNVFRRCNSHDNEEDGFDIKQGPNTIEYCTADLNTHHAVVFHQFAEQVTIRYNIFTNCTKGIYTVDGVEVSTGNDNIYYNVIGLKSSGADQAIQLNANGPIYFYNNVIYAPSATGNSAINIVTTANNGVTFKNNIVYVTGNTAIWCQAADTFDFDNNCYYRTNVGDTWKWTGTGYDTIAGWRTASSQDASSINIDPKMVDAANSIFKILMGSPCRNAGTDVSLIQDILGIFVRHAPDIGAYEDSTNSLF